MENLRPRRRGSVQRKIRATKAVSHRRSGSNCITPPPADRIRREFSGLCHVLLHRHQTSKRTSTHTPDRRQPVLRPLPAQTIALRRKPSSFPSTFHNGQCKKLMPRKNSDIPRLQSGHLSQSLRLGKPTADMPVGTQCIKKPVHGITPADKHAAGCNKNTGRIKSGQHTPLINGESLQLNAKVTGPTVQRLNGDQRWARCAGLRMRRRVLPWYEAHQNR